MPERDAGDVNGHGNGNATDNVSTNKPQFWFIIVEIYTPWNTTIAFLLFSLSEFSFASFPRRRHRRRRLSLHLRFIFTLRMLARGRAEKWQHFYAPHGTIFGRNVNVKRVFIRKLWISTYRAAQTHIHLLCYCHSSVHNCRCGAGSEKTKI